MKIREIILSDSDFLFELYLKRDSQDIITSINSKDQINFVRNYLKHADSTPFQSWCIIEVDGTRIGSLTLNKQNNEIGFWILELFQSKGYGTKAIQEFIEINKKSFYTVKAHKENSKSNGVIKKLGFKLSHNYYTLNL